MAILYSCAHPITPGGGPKDEVAPEILLSIPENGSANFTTNKFSVEFNEFVKLEDIFNEALISPPLETRPDFKIKGKAVQVKFNEDLKPNTTYSVYFGDAITDITESNPVSNFTYIFSTGQFVDSLSLQGIVLDAQNHQPIEGCFVMLYKDNNDTIVFDSLPLLVRPYYLSKTNEEGSFRFNGLGNDEYLMFAILDMNASLSFDQPNEAIAFMDSLVSPSFVVKPVIDTTIVDSTLVDTTLLNLDDKTVSVIKDSLLSKTDLLFNDQLETHYLYLYDEKPSTLRLLSSKIIRDNTIEFVFNMPTQDVSISPVNIADRELWYIPVASTNNDTVTWYYKNLEVDTLQVLIRYQGDTLEFLNIRLDKQLQKSARKRNKDIAESLKWTAIPESKSLNPKMLPQIRFYQPIESINFDSAVLITSTDTIINPEYSFSDSLNMRIVIPIENIEDSYYTLIIPDSSIYDWNGLANEEMLIKFNTPKLSDYSTLTMKYNLKTPQQVIIQMVNDEDVVLQQNIIKSDTSILYEYKNAATYRLKAIYDSNSNGKWDPGSYINRIQAEKVIYYPKELELRANWEFEEEWNLD